MILPLYLAMTCAEMWQVAPLPQNVAWMACHFSAYGTGLSNFPQSLPAGSIIIVNDRMPPCSHDPEFICRQLQELVSDQEAAGVLLDFQRPDDPQTEKIAKAITQSADFPVGVSAAYAEALSCAVFLDPPPLRRSLQNYLQPWDGRELWLDVALHSERIRVTESGSSLESLFPPECNEDGFEDPKLHCRYSVEEKENKLLFTLWRTESCLHALLQEAHTLGVTKAFGLYQQLGRKKPAD